MARPDAPQLPSITDLGRIQAALSRVHNRLDQSSLSGKGPPDKHRDSGMDLISWRQNALNDLIGTLPARTLADCAVQLAVANLFASGLEADDDDKRSTLAKAIERITVSIIKVVVEVGGLDAAEFDLEQFACLHEARFPAGVQ